MNKKKVLIIILIFLLLISIFLFLYLNKKTEIPRLEPITVGTFVKGKNRTLTGGPATYMNPIIPVGFKAVSDGASWKFSGDIVEGWNDGLVIEDEKGNQFVWVPVDGKKVKYEKWCFDSLELSPSYLHVTGDDTSSGIDEMHQINKYQGFYIGRYEAGRSDLDYVSPEINDVSEGVELLIKKDAQVWGYISYTNSKKVAESYVNNEHVKSSLLTGTQFDTTLKWIENAGYNVTEDSSEWGNYFNVLDINGYGRYTYDSNYEGQNWTTGEYNKNKLCVIFTGTGSYEKAQAKNIYDLAGGVREWTTEEFFVLDQELYISRGGNAHGNSFEIPASFRARNNSDYTTSLLGFRVALYVE